jgi:hypothetical protein
MCPRRGLPSAEKSAQPRPRVLGAGVRMLLGAVAAVGSDEQAQATPTRLTDPTRVSPSYAVFTRSR